MVSETDFEQLNIRKEKRYRRISFWLSIILSTVTTVWYSTTTPPDTPEVQRMRMFFKDNNREVATFLRLPAEEKVAFAKTRKHPFYKTYLDASTVEKEKIKALVHVSYDYTPNQYWFNLAFLWTIFFATLWFLGLMIEAAIILTRRSHQARRNRKKNRISEGKIE